MEAVVEEVIIVEKQPVVPEIVPNDIALDFTSPLGGMALFCAGCPFFNGGSCAKPPGGECGQTSQDSSSDSPEQPIQDSLGTGIITADTILDDPDYQDFLKRIEQDNKPPDEDKIVNDVKPSQSAPDVKPKKPAMGGSIILTPEPDLADNVSQPITEVSTQPIPIVPSEVDNIIEVIDQDDEVVEEKIEKTPITNPKTIVREPETEKPEVVEPVEIKEVEPVKDVAEIIETEDEVFEETEIKIEVEVEVLETEEYQESTEVIEQQFEEMTEPSELPEPSELLSPPLIYTVPEVLVDNIIDETPETLTGCGEPPDLMVEEEISISDAVAEAYVITEPPVDLIETCADEDIDVLPSDQDVEPSEEESVVLQTLEQVDEINLNEHEGSELVLDTEAIEEDTEFVELAEELSVALVDMESDVSVIIRNYKLMTDMADDNADSNIDRPILEQSKETELVDDETDELEPSIFDLYTVSTRQSSSRATNKKSHIVAFLAIILSCRKNNLVSLSLS